MAHRHPENDRPISSSVARTIESAGLVVKHAIRGMGRQRAMAVAGIGIAAIFIVLLVRSVSIAPDAGGVLAAIFASAFAALLFGAFAAWMLMWAFSDAAPHTIDRASVADFEGAMESTLSEVQQVRAGVAHAVRQRSFRRVPLGIAAGVLLWTLLQWSDDPPSLLALVAFAVIGAVAAATRSHMTSKRR